MLTNEVGMVARESLVLYFGMVAVCLTVLACTGILATFFSFGLMALPAGGAFCIWLAAAGIGPATWFHKSRNILALSERYTSGARCRAWSQATRMPDGGAPVVGTLLRTDTELVFMPQDGDARWSAALSQCVAARLLTVEWPWPDAIELTAGDAVVRFAVADPRGWAASILGNNARS